MTRVTDELVYLDMHGSSVVRCPLELVVSPQTVVLILCTSIKLSKEKEAAYKHRCEQNELIVFHNSSLHSSVRACFTVTA